MGEVGGSDQLIPASPETKSSLLVPLRDPKLAPPGQLGIEKVWTWPMGAPQQCFMGNSYRAQQPMCSALDVLAQPSSCG
jgi:hypothetical protein